MELIDTVIWSLMDLILVCIIFFLFDSLLLGYKYISFEILIGLFCETEDRLHIYAKLIVYLLSLSVSLCVSLCAFLSLCLSHSFCVSFSFSLYLSLSLRVCVSVCLSPPPFPVCLLLSISLCLCLCVGLSVCLCVGLSVCLCPLSLSVCNVIHTNQCINTLETADCRAVHQIHWFSTALETNRMQMGVTEGIMVLRCNYRELGISAISRRLLCWPKEDDGRIKCPREMVFASMR